MLINIRLETPDDIETIEQITIAAFQNQVHSNQTEHLVVSGLRDGGALSVSLVAEINGQMVGHIAFSPVTIDSELKDWYGLGPISVLPDYQRQGVGSALIHDGLLKIRDLGAKGCVLLGDPAYYRRFGFLPHPDLVLAGVSPEYFQTISFGNETPRGKVEYHQAFSVCDS